MAIGLAFVPEKSSNFISFNKLVLKLIFTFSKQVIKQKISSEAKIILVIDRVDRFIDPSESKEANIAFWLPKELPDKVRVIVTCDRNSESFAYFEKNKARILEINEDIEITSFMVKRNEEKDQFIEPDIRARLMECYNGFGENLKKDCKFVEAFLSAFLPTPNELIPSLGKREKMELNQILKSLEFSHVSSKTEKKNCSSNKANYSFRVSKFR